jgi:hypothetical protein
MTYPNSAGFKEETTSKEAAEHIESSGAANILRIRVMEYVRDRRYLGTTPDACATALGESVLAIRPRFTELEQKGMIRRTKLTEKNESGRNAAVYLHAGLYASK